MRQAIALLALNRKDLAKRRGHARIVYDDVNTTEVVDGGLDDGLAILH